MGSAEVELVPTAQGFDAKASALIGELHADVRLDADVLGLRRQVAEITDLKVGVEAELHDLVAKAEIEKLTGEKRFHLIPELVSGVVNAELDIMTRPRTIEITPVKMPEVDLNGPATAAEDIGASGNGGPAGIIALATAITMLVTALVPVAGVTTAAALGIGGLVLAGGGAVGVFAGVVAAALATDKAFQDSLMPSLNGLKGAFDDFVNQNSAALLAPLQAGMQLLAQILPALTPLLQAGSQALLALIKPLQDAVSSGAFSKFIEQLTPLVGPAVSALGQIFGNLTEGLVKMMLAFAPFGQVVLNGLVGLSKAFASFTSTQAFKDFMADVTKEAPTVGQFFVSLLNVVGPLLPILSQLGTQALAEMIPELGSIGPLLQALIPLFAAMTPVVIDIAKVMTVLVQILMTYVIPAIGAVVGVVVGFIGWIKGWMDWLVALAHGNEEAVAQVSGVWDGLMGFFAGVGAFFAGIWNGLVTGVSNMVNQVGAWFGSLPGRIMNAFAGAGSWLLDTGQQIVNGLWNGVRGMWNGFMGWLNGMINSIPKAVRDVLGIASPSKVMAEIGGFIGQGLQQGMEGSIGTAMDSARSLVGAGVSKLSTSAVATVQAQIDAAGSFGTAAATSSTLLQQLVTLITALLNKTATPDEIARANRLLGRTGVA